MELTDLHHTATDFFLNGVKIGKFTFVPVNIVMGLALFLLLLSAARVIDRWLKRHVLPRTHIDLSTQYLIRKILYYVLALAAIMIGLTVSGVNLSGLTIIISALSVGLGFGLQNIVNNFVSGLIILFERPVRIGDSIIVQGMEGIVRRMTLRSTHLETGERAIIIIPNSMLLSEPVTNWTHGNVTGRVRITVNAAFGSDTDTVKSILLETANNHDHVLKDPTPFVWLEQFGETGLGFSLFAFVDNVNVKGSVASDLRMEINQKLRENNIEIPTLQRLGPATS